MRSCPRSGPHGSSASAAAGSSSGPDPLDEYLSKFRPDLMEPVAAWVRGAKFAELAKMTSVFEVGGGWEGWEVVGRGIGCVGIGPMPGGQCRRGIVAG